MKICSITYDDTETIDTITVTMNLREATALHAIAGKLNGHACRRLGLEGHDSLYDTLADVFNGHYDDGRPPGAPRITDLGSLNEAPA